jgi:hypothetical protein
MLARPVRAGNPAVGFDKPRRDGTLEEAVSYQPSAKPPLAHGSAGARERGRTEVWDHLLPVPVPVLLLVLVLAT